MGGGGQVISPTIESIVFGIRPVVRPVAAEVSYSHVAVITLNEP